MLKMEVAVYTIYDVLETHVTAQSVQPKRDIILKDEKESLKHGTYDIN